MSMCPLLNVPSWITPNAKSFSLTYDPSNQCPTIEGINYKYGMQLNYTVTQNVGIIEGFITRVDSAIKRFFVDPNQAKLDTAIEATILKDSEAFLSLAINGKIFTSKDECNCFDSFHATLLELVYSAGSNYTSFLPTLLDLGAVATLNPKYLSKLDKLHAVVVLDPHNSLESQLRDSAPIAPESSKLLRYYGLDVGKKRG